MARKHTKTSVKTPPVGSIRHDDPRLVESPHNIKLRTLLKQAGQLPGEDEQAAFELSVRNEGVHTPIVLRRSPTTPGKLEIVAGNRRRAAVKKAATEARKAKADYPFEELPYRLIEFADEREARAFCLKDNLDELRQNWKIPAPQRLAILFPPTEKENRKIYADLKGNYAYAEIGVDPKKKKPTRAERERARSIRIEQRNEQRQARELAAELIGVQPDAMPQYTRRVLARFFPKAERKAAIPDAHRTEAYVVAAQRKDILKAQERIEKEIDRLEGELARDRPLLQAVDRRLRNLGGGADPEDVARIALRKKPKVAAAQKKKLQIKKPKINRRAKKKKAPAKTPQPELFDLLRPQPKKKRAAGRKKTGKKNG